MYSGQEYPRLFRRRLIPDECVELKDDEILYLDDDILVTKWKTLKPRKDFHHGYSCYFFKEGIKVSRFLREDESLHYWYCDIVTYSYDKDKNELTIVDLLADVTVDANGCTNVLDIDELCDAKARGHIDEADFFASVKQLGDLIKAIQQGRFNEYTDRLMKYVK